MGAEISVQGEDEAKKKQADKDGEEKAKLKKQADKDNAKLKKQADKVNIHDAAGQGKAAEVQLVLAIYPDRVNAKENQLERTPLHYAASDNECEVAEILIVA